MDDKTKMMRAKFMMNNKALSQESRDAHKAQYRALGGDLLSGVGNLLNARNQRKAARNQRDQTVGNAQIAGGLRGIDAASRNFAGLQQMGLDRAYNPVDTSLGMSQAYKDIGAAESALGNAEADISNNLITQGQEYLADKEAEEVAAAEYARDIAREDEVLAQKAANSLELAEAKKKKADDVVDETAQNMILLAQRGKLIVAGASNAGDIVNGFKLFDKKKQAEVDAETDNLVAQGTKAVKDFIADWGTALSGLSESTAKVKEAVVRKYASKEFPRSYAMYVQIEKLSNQMIFPILEAGTLGVNPTDADAQLARDATFNPLDRSSTWMSQFDSVIADAQGSSAEDYFEIVFGDLPLDSQPVIKPEGANNGGGSVGKKPVIPVVEQPTTTGTIKDTITNTLDGWRSKIGIGG